jgi:DNA-binding transcriptional regulator YiaG
MHADEILSVQQRLGLSDTKLAAALGVTRQTVGNWKRGKACPRLARNAIRWMLELRRLEPANDNLPRAVQVQL